MFIFFLQLRETLHGGRVYVFTVLVLFTWALWFVKASLSRRYRPWTNDYEMTASVVIPVVDEPVGLFHEVLDLITEQHPHQTIVVINGPRNVKLERGPATSSSSGSATRTRAWSGPGPPSPASATRSTRGSSAARATSSCSSTATRSGPKER